MSALTVLWTLAIAVIALSSLGNFFALIHLQKTLDGWRADQFDQHRAEDIRRGVLT
jgi:hypothetical protein